MRLYKYINEKDVLDLNNEIGDMNDKIQENCGPYLKLIKGKDPLARGMKTTTDDTGVKQVRKDRESKGMSEDIFKEFNQWLEKNGHNRKDKSISVLSNPINLGMFAGSGIIAYVFPIGKFSYTWIKATDVNMDSKTGWDENAVEMYLRNDTDTTEKGFENYFFTDKGFDKAYRAEWEIWINCDYYYFVSKAALRTAKMKWDPNKQKFKG